jgi:hypothetical protein
VPREARLVKDAQGKLVFIGDCAPLSFYQSVRQLVTSRIDPLAFAQQTSQPSVLQNSRTAPTSHGNGFAPILHPQDVTAHVKLYQSVATGLVDLFPESYLPHAIVNWASSPPSGGLTSLVNYLVLAIGIQSDDESTAQSYFNYAKDQALLSLGGDLSIETVQIFTLVTLYMLRAYQTNAAFIFLGIAVRAAYSIGIHRAEANAMFGEVVGRQRDRLWKSLRLVDLYLSVSIGRPPATSDVDCTVPYHAADETGKEAFDLLNAHVQILLISEAIVLEVYSRKKISLAITEDISSQLREWSLRWLKILQDALATPSTDHDPATVSGVCQVLSTYYYAVMLVSRPFLMYEVCRRLSESSAQSAMADIAASSGRSKLADACIDAASLLVDCAMNLIQRSDVKERMPLVV